MTIGSFSGVSGPAGLQRPQDSPDLPRSRLSRPQRLHRQDQRPSEAALHGSGHSIIESVSGLMKMMWNTSSTLILTLFSIANGWMNGWIDGWMDGWNDR